MLADGATVSSVPNRAVGLSTAGPTWAGAAQEKALMLTTKNWSMYFFAVLASVSLDTT